jgi:hypothetical protein
MFYCALVQHLHYAAPLELDSFWPILADLRFGLDCVLVLFLFRLAVGSVEGPSSAVLVGFVAIEKEPKGEYVLEVGAGGNWGGPLAKGGINSRIVSICLSGAVGTVLGAKVGGVWIERGRD